MPTYVAIDYAKRGHPALSAGDVAEIRRDLAKVRSCQRSLVRYVLPAGPGSIALFFAIPLDSAAHIFNEGDDYYVPLQDGGSLIPLPGDTENYQLIERQGIQWDIAHQRCP